MKVARFAAGTSPGLFGFAGVTEQEILKGGGHGLVRWIPTLRGSMMKVELFRRSRGD